MIDVHVHYFPPPVFEAIWRYFDTHDGLWPVRYKLHGEQHRRTIAGFGVKKFTTLVYAHKPGLAAYLNDYVRQEAQQHSELIPFGTIYAGDGKVEQTAIQLFDEWGFYGIKLHPYVCGERLDDPRFYPAYDLMQATGKTVLCHPGSAPHYPASDGAQQLRTVLTQFPRLKIIIAHLGAFEYTDYMALADRYEHLYFDTAMTCVSTPYFPNNQPPPDFMLRYLDRVLFGSDYPNIPYTYDTQVAAFDDLPDAIRTRLFEANATRVLGL